MVLSNGFTRDPRVANEAESLVRNGYEVTVLCWDRDGTLPPQETRNGIRVLRLRNTAWMQLLPYDLFRLRPFWRLALRRSLDLNASTPFAAIHCHDFDTLPVGTSLKVRTGLPLIYDAHEIWGYLMAHELPGDWG
ncbi:MAG: glycosyltransferase, partial [bacterium]